MAQVAQDSRLGQRIDAYLSYLVDVWSDVPHLAAEWDDLDEHERDDAVLDWEGPPADRLLMLREWAEHGLLTPSQRQRYDLLLCLVAEHGPVLGRLFGDDVWLGTEPLRRARAAER